MTDINTGLDGNSRLAIADGLKTLLGDTYEVYMKTHGFHWNVTGMHFNTLHTMFETQYNEMWMALDEIAERIRALGAFAPGSGRTLADASTIEPAPDTPPAAADMVKILLDDHETLIRRARESLSAAEDAGDVATADLIAVRIQTHEKTAWMLRAMTA